MEGPAEVLILLHPIGKRLGLPEGFAEAIGAKGPLLFRLKIKGEPQGPWDVRAEFESRRRLVLVSGWRTFASFYQLQPGFILRFKLCAAATISIKVYDGTLIRRD